MQPLPNSESDTDGSSRALSPAPKPPSKATPTQALRELLPPFKQARVLLDSVSRGQYADDAALRQALAEVLGAVKQLANRQAALDQTAPPAATDTTATQTFHTLQQPSAPASSLLDDPAASDPYSSNGATSEQRELASADGSNAASEHPVLWEGGETGHRDFGPDDVADLVAHEALAHISATTLRSAGATAEHDAQPWDEHDSSHDGPAAEALRPGHVDGDAGQAYGELDGDSMPAYAAKMSGDLELEAEWDAEPSVAVSSRTRTETCDRVDAAEEVATEQTRSGPSSALPDNLRTQSDAVAPFSMHMQLDASDAYAPGQATTGSAMRSASSNVHNAIVAHNSGAARDPALHVLAASRSTDSGYTGHAALDSDAQAASEIRAGGEAPHYESRVSSQHTLSPASAAANALRDEQPTSEHEGVQSAVTAATGAAQLAQGESIVGVLAADELLDATLEELSMDLDMDGGAHAPSDAISTRGRDDGDGVGAAPALVDAHAERSNSSGAAVTVAGDNDEEPHAESDAGELELAEAASSVAGLEDDGEELHAVALLDGDADLQAALVSEAGDTSDGAELADVGPQEYGGDGASADSMRVESEQDYAARTTAVATSDLEVAETGDRATWSSLAPGESAEAELALDTLVGELSGLELDEDDEYEV